MRECVKKVGVYEEKGWMGDIVPVGLFLFVRGF